MHKFLWKSCYVFDCERYRGMWCKRPSLVDAQCNCVNKFNFWRNFERRQKRKKSKSGKNNFAKITNWRSQIRETAKIKSFVIFNNQSLSLALLDRRPNQKMWKLILLFCSIILSNNVLVLVSALRDSVSTVSSSRDRVVISLPDSSSRRQSLVCPGTNTIKLFSLNR